MLVHLWIRQMTFCGLTNYGKTSIPKGEAACKPWRWKPQPDLELCPTCEENWSKHQVWGDASYEAGRIVGECPCPHHEGAWEAIIAVS